SAAASRDAEARNAGARVSSGGAKGATKARTPVPESGLEALIAYPEVGPASPHGYCQSISEDAGRLACRVGRLPFQCAENRLSVQTDCPCRGPACSFMRHVLC